MVINYCLALFLFMFLFVVISTAIWFGLNRNKSNRREIAEFARVFFFFFCIEHFILSAVKWYLGSGSDTLFESFWDIELRTYIHYGIPLFIVSIVAPLVLKALKEDLGRKLTSMFIAWIFPGIFIAFFVMGGISNAIYCALFLLCGVFSVLTTFLHKKECIYFQKQEYRKILLGSLPFLGSWVMMHGIYLPNELYLGNLDEFVGEFGSFFLIMLIGSCLLTIGISVAGIMLLPKSVYKGMSLTIAAITIMSYIQSMFLNGKLSILNGSEQEWSVVSKMTNIVIWICVIGIILALGYIKKNMERIVGGICIYIALIQVVSLGYLVLTTNISQRQQQGALTTDNSLELAEGNNVLVFVLDRFESLWMQELLNDQEEFLEPLSDFTFYRNATSQFADTVNSIPYMLTGTQCPEGMELEYREYAYSNSNFLSDMKQQNYDLGIYTNASYVSESVYKLTTNYKEDIKRNYNILQTFMTMWKCSMYKTTPFFIKPMHAYYTSDIVEMVCEKDVWSIENDIPFYESLRKEGLTVTDNYPNAFRFYHMRGAHEPYYLSEELQYNRTGRDVGLYTQIKGSLKIVYEYLNQLKALDKYDDTTIIITADHGQQVEFVEEEGKPNKTLMPTILVKQPGERHESIVYSEIPVSHTEFLATVAKAGGLDWKDYGNSLDEVSEVDTKERVCVSLWYGHIIKYTINGDARNLDNWKAVEIEPLKQE